MKYQDNLPKLKLCNLKTHMIFLPKNEFFKLHNHRGLCRLPRAQARGGASEKVPAPQG